MDRSLGTNLMDAPDIIAEWPLSLFSCFSYRDPVYNSCRWFPYFCPMALCGTCCIVGRIHSRLQGESPLCCDMGPSGWCCCAISAPVNAAAPFGGACYFRSIGAVFLTDMERQYSLPRHPSQECCFGDNCCNYCCEIVYSSVFYPCLFFQIYMTLKEIDIAQSYMKTSAQGDLAPSATAATFNPQQQQQQQEEQEKHDGYGAPMPIASAIPIPSASGSSSMIK